MYASTGSNAPRQVSEEIESVTCDKSPAKGNAIAFKSEQVMCCSNPEKGKQSHNIEFGLTSETLKQNVKYESIEIPACSQDCVKHLCQPVKIEALKASQIEMQRIAERHGRLLSTCYATSLKSSDSKQVVELAHEALELNSGEELPHYRTVVPVRQSYYSLKNKFVSESNREGWHHYNNSNNLVYFVNNAEQWIVELPSLSDYVVEQYPWLDTAFGHLVCYRANNSDISVTDSICEISNMLEAESALAIMQILTSIMPCSRATKALLSYRCSKPIRGSYESWVDTRDACKSIASHPEEDDEDFCVTCSHAKFIISEKPFLHKKTPIGEVPERDAQWAKEHQCRDNTHNKHSCPVFKLSDFNSGLSESFERNLKKFIESARACLKTSQSMTKRVRREIILDVRSNPYVIWATQTPDKEQMPIESNEDYFLSLYYVREKCGMNGDYGYSNHLFRQEGFGLESLSFGFLDSFKSFEKLSFKEPVVMVKTIVKNIFDGFSNLFEFISNKISEYLDRVMSFLVTYITDLIVIKGVEVSAAMNKLIRAVIVITLLSLLACSIIGSSLAILTIRYFSNVEVSEDDLSFSNDDFISEGPKENVSLIVSILVGIFGNSMNQESTIQKRCLQITALMSAGTALSTPLMSLFGALPYALRSSLAFSVGNKTIMQEMEFDHWRMQSDVLVVASRVPTVLASEIYKTKIKQSIREGSRLVKEIEDHKLRIPFMRTFSQLIKINMMMAQMEYAGEGRELPFSFHMSGEPGIGKSLITSRLLNEVFGLTKSDVFYRTNADSYWNGYLAQPCVVYDEFLGNSDLESAIANEYLELISTQNFVAPMASVDNPLVGVKGTLAKPEVVFTINNTNYQRPLGVNEFAFQRRRQFVVVIEKSEEYVGSGNAINMQAFSDADLKRVAWAKFRLLPGLWRKEAEKDFVTYPYMNFSCLLDIIHEQFEFHKKQCERVSDTIVRDQSEAKTPDEILNELTQDMFEVPKKPVNLIEAIAKFLGFKAETRIDEHMHTCVCGDTKFHGSYIGVFECRAMVKKPAKDKSTFEVAPCGHKMNCTRPDVMTGIKGIEEFEDYVMHHQRNYRIMESPIVFSQRQEAFKTAIKECAGFALYCVKITILLIVVLFSISSLFGQKQKKSRVTFRAETPNGKNNNNSRMRRSKQRITNFRRGFEAQASNSIPMLSLDNASIPCSFIKENVILLPAHYFYKSGHPIEEGLEMNLRYNGVDYKAVFNSADVVMDLKNDVAFLEYQCKQLPLMRDMVGKFISEADLTTLVEIPVKMSTPKGAVYSKARLTGNFSYRTTIPTARNDLERCWFYPAFTDIGDCGSLLSISSGPLMGRIIGMHVAGTESKDYNPKGLSTVITREVIMAAFPDESDEEYVIEADRPTDIIEQLAFSPNVVEVSRISKEECVHLNRKSKLKCSVLNKHLDIPLGREFPILSNFDERANGKDPAVEALKDYGSTVQIETDESLWDEIFQTMGNNYEKQLEWPAGKRCFSFIEACVGIPGILCSIDTATSKGYPLCYESVRPGKKDCIWFDALGEFHYNQHFREMCEAMFEEMKGYTGQDLRNRFIGHLKDEMVSMKKIINCRTRMIYANDVVFLVAFRMHFGALMAAFNNSHKSTSQSIGINQYSHDMELVYDYLVNGMEGVYLNDGDFESFDKRLLNAVRVRAFALFGKLASWTNKPEQDYVTQHESQPLIQVLDILIRFHSINPSGGVYTTPLNGIMNEAYWRYIFAKRFPGLIFNDHVRLKVLGDDHLTNFSPEVAERWSPLMIQQDMLAIGQSYTAAQKGEELKNSFKKRFSDCLFLGAHPRLVNGLYSGALKKETLTRMVQLTRDNNMTLELTVKQAVELATQWDEEWFNGFYKMVKAACDLEGISLEFTSYKEMSRIVSQRTASSGLFYNMYRAEADRPPLVSAISSASGMTTIRASAVGQSQPSFARMDELAGLAINETKAELFTGLDTAMFRATYNWTTSQAAEVELASVPVPFGLLALGNSDNIQNMPFEHYIYFTSDVEITIQTVSNPFFQGLLYAYFVPLDDLARSRSTATSMGGVYISAEESTTAVLNIPFHFFRSAMNTYAGALGTESMGTFKIMVFSPLMPITGQTPTVDVTIFSRFPKARFAMPRPVIPTAFKKFNKCQEKEQYRAEGGNISKVENRYDIHHVVGDIPIQTRTDPSQTTTQKFDTKLEGVPMDNPPLASGSIPMYGQTPSLSKCVGVDPMLALQLHPEQMFREHFDVLNTADTKIENLCAKEGWFAEVTWTKDQATGTNLLTVPLNSVLSYPNQLWALALNFTGLHEIPANVAILNLFQFWRADIEIIVRTAKTKFHSGKIQATVAYGAPSVASSERNVFINKVLDLTQEGQQDSILIPYNAAQEFLKTYEGTQAHNLVQDYSMGTLMFTVNNALNSINTTVNPTVNVLFFVKFHNTRVYDIKTSIPFVVADSASPNYCKPETHYVTTGPTTTTNDSIVMSSPKMNCMTVSSSSSFSSSSDDSFVQESDPREITEPSSATGVETPTTLTSEETPIPIARMCNLNIGRKFEYHIVDVHEYLRRYKQLMRLYSDNATFGCDIDQDGLVTRVTSLEAQPINEIKDFFAVWAGHLNYRVTSYKAPFIVNYLADQTYHILPYSRAYPKYETNLDYTGLNDQVNWVNPLTSVYLWRDDTILNANVLENLRPSIPEEYSTTYFPYYAIVSVPFNTQYNCLATTSRPNPFNYPTTVGRLIIKEHTGDTTKVFGNHLPTIHQSIGDDFRFGVYRPPVRIYFCVYTAAANTARPNITKMYGFYENNFKI